MQEKKTHVSFELTCHRVEGQGFHQDKDRKEQLVGNRLGIPLLGNHLAWEDKNRHRRTSTVKEEQKKKPKRHREKEKKNR